MLQIRYLQATIADEIFLNGLSLTISAGDIRAIMGLNGAGKSTAGASLCTAGVSG